MPKRLRKAQVTALCQKGKAKAERMKELRALAKKLAKENQEFREKMDLSQERK